MELWIRSQDREKLVKANALDLYDRNILKNDFVLTNENEKDYSNIMIIANDNVNLGIYKSKERALEVLDEIYEMLKGAKIIDFINKTNGTMNNVFPIITYEMPQK